VILLLCVNICAYSQKRMHINVNLSLFFIYAYVHLIIRKKNMPPGTAPGNGEMDLDFHVAFSISLHLLYWVTVHLSFSLYNVS